LKEEKMGECAGGICTDPGRIGIKEDGYEVTGQNERGMEKRIGNVWYLCGKGEERLTKTVCWSWERN
jgi:hypothetical protein